MTTTKIEYAVKRLNSKFVVTKNGEPIVMTASAGQSIVTEFDCKEDAERYLSILQNLKK
jgi:hypothetical protein